MGRREFWFRWMEWWRFQRGRRQFWRWGRQRAMVNIFLKISKKKILEAIQKAEAQTSGEIRVHIQHNCPGDVLAAAQKTFIKLGMQRTKNKNAVLIFISLRNRFFAIVGDEGIHRHVLDSFWNETRDAMSKYFTKGLMEEGILYGIDSVGKRLKEHFSRGKNDINELPDTPTH